MTTQRLFMLVVSVHFLLFFSQSASGQKDSARNTKQDCEEKKEKDPDDKFIVCKSEIDRFEPGWQDRVLRSLQYEYTLIEQPLFVAASSGGATQIIENPSVYLNQHSITMQFSELFPGTSNFATIVQRVYADASLAEKNKPRSGLQLDPKFCGPNSQTLTCLASGGRWWERFLSGVGLTLSLSERPDVQQGLVIAGLPFSQHYGLTGKVVFDPTSLFVTATNWKSALATVDGMAIADKDNCLLTASKIPMAKDVEGCRSKFWKQRLNPSKNQGVGTWIAGVLIPKVQFQAVSQFDFIKNGGTFIPESNLQGSLKTYTLTWNFSHVIPSTTDRIAIDTAYENYKPSSPREGRTSSEDRPSKLCVTISVSSRNYIAVGDSSPMHSCKNLAGSIGAEHFALACATDDQVLIGAPVAIDSEADISDAPKSNACKWKE